MDPIKILLVILGTLSLLIGITGIIVPGLPTTPFILLTAGLYMRSSDKLYQKLLANKWINRYLSDYRRNKGMTKRAKLSVIVLMWAMISASCIFFISADLFKLIVLIIGITGTYVMGWLVPTADAKH